MTEPEDRDAVRALRPEDREWLTKQGWRDTTDDYPEIGTERVTE